MALDEEDSIANFIKETRAALDDIKKVQYVGGSSALLYLTGSDNQYDLHTYSNEYTKTYLYTLTYNTAKYGIMYPSIYFSIDNPDVMNNYETQIEVGSQEIEAGYAMLPPEEGLYKMAIIVVNNTYFTGPPVNHDVYVKVYLSGTDTGPWTFEPYT